MLKALGGTRTLSDHYMQTFLAPELFREAVVEDFDFPLINSLIYQSSLQNYYM